MMIRNTIGPIQCKQTTNQPIECTVCNVLSTIIAVAAATSGVIFPREHTYMHTHAETYVVWIDYLA